MREGLRMSVANDRFGLASFAALLSLVVGCTSAPPSEPDAGSTTPTEDGAVCACATPDCLPNCSDLPPCTLECFGGVTLRWVDPCGMVDYAQNCPSGCLDAATYSQCSD
jgi:hypothetical protein